VAKKKKKEEGKTYKGEACLQKAAKKIFKTSKSNRYQVSGEGIAGEIYLPNDVVMPGDHVIIKIV